MTIISLQELRVFFWDRHCDKSSGFDSSKPAPATHLSLNSSKNPRPCANISSRDSRQSCWSLHWVFPESVYLAGGQPRSKIGSPLWQRHEERSKRLELWCEVRCRPEPKLRESKKVISDKISLIPLLLLSNNAEKSKINRGAITRVFFRKTSVTSLLLLFCATVNIFPRLPLQAHVFPRLTIVTCFDALGAICIFVWSSDRFPFVLGLLWLSICDTLTNRSITSEITP